MDTTLNECSLARRRVGTYIILTLGLQREIELSPAWADVPARWHADTEIFHLVYFKYTNVFNKSLHKKKPFFVS